MSYGEVPPSGNPPPPPAGFTPPGAPTSDDRTWAMLSHLSVFVVGIIGPLVVMLTKGEQSPFVKDQAKEALNFQITTMIAIVVSIVLMVVVIGIFTLFAALIGAWVFAVIGAIAANKGEAYRYPVNIRLVK